MNNAADTAVMLKEMAAVGIPMTLALILVWIGLVLVYEKVLAPQPVESRLLGK